jgi:CheY-like chemotaxis protein
VKAKILIVDDTDNLRKDLKDTVSRGWPECETTEVKNEMEAEELIRRGEFAVLVADIDLSGGGGDVSGGLHLLEVARQIAPSTPVVVVTSFDRRENRSRTEGLSAIYVVRSGDYFGRFLDALAALREKWESRPRRIRHDSLCWLHLSDLHSCEAKTGWDAHRVLLPLAADLRAMQSAFDLSPQFIFFTGDAAYGDIGSKKAERLDTQFDKAKEFLDGVRTTLAQQVPKENVFVVPGNHDVSRTAVHPEETQWLDNQTDPDEIVKLWQADARLKRYMARLTAYQRFVRRCEFDHLLEDSLRLSYGVVREVCGRKVGIGGFNSAWTCNRDNEKGKLWLSAEWQAGTIQRKLVGADLRIALVHHPYGWLVESEDSSLRRGIENTFDFFLHGHEHLGWVDQKAGGHVRIGAAACYDRSTRDNGYNFVRIDLETGEGEVWLRRYDHTGQGWVPHIIARGTDNNGMWRLQPVATGRRRSGAAQ